MRTPTTTTMSMCVRECDIQRVEGNHVTRCVSVLHEQQTRTWTTQRRAVDDVFGCGETTDTTVWSESVMFSCCNILLLLLPFNTCNIITVSWLHREVSCCFSK